MSDLTYLRVIKSETQLRSILGNCRELCPTAYILMMFLVYTGMQLQEILSLKVVDVKGNSFYVKRFERFFIYGEGFSMYLRNYFIENGLLDNDDIFLNPSFPGRTLIQPEATVLIKNIFKELGYKGSPKTLNRTFYYMFAMNNGSIEKIFRKAYESKWIENTLGLSYEKYQSFKERVVPGDVLVDCLSLSFDSFLRESVSKLQDEDTTDETRASIQKHLYEVYKAVYLSSVDASVNSLPF